MAKQLIINAIEPREVRAAILEDGEPSHFFVERSKRRFQKGNIYRARVTSIEPHLQAAFVELEKGQHGFLGLSDIILPDAGVSLINGLPAPEMPSNKDEKNTTEETPKKAQEENKEVDSSEETTLEDEPFDEVIIEAPKKGPKPKAIELSPVAGDMLLGLESDLNSPIQEVTASETNEETTNTEESSDTKSGDTLLNVTTPESKEQNTDSEVTNVETPIPAPSKGEALLHPEEPEKELAAEEKVDSVDLISTSTEEASTPEEAKTEEVASNDDKSDMEDASVDTAIFSVDDVSTEPEVEAEGIDIPSETEGIDIPDQTEESAGKTESEPENSENESASPQKENKARFKPRNKGYRKPQYQHSKRRRPNMKIEDVLEVGQYIVVQITKEGIGNKAPMVSTLLSLAGHYMVLTPGGDRSGVSKQVRVQAERSRLKKFIDDNEIPERCGLIVRTAAEGISEKDLKSDIDNLCTMWSDLQKSFKRLNRSGVIKQEEALASRLVRDYYQQDIEEVWVDDKKTYDEIKNVFEKGMSDQIDRLHFFEEPTPIFYHHKVEAAIKGLFNRRVPLPGGGSLIFDQNEAMLVIDVNSGTFKEGEDDEDTAFKLNLIACKEVSRQVQMRDVGGIVMIDFVDMRRLSNRSKVEKELEKCFKGDKARINIMHIGALGVLQMSRQRTKDSLRANLYSNCPHCDGTGLVPSKTHSAMSILREIRGNIKRYKGGVLKVKTTSDIAIELLNTYKSELSSLEEKEGAQIQIDIDPKLKIGEFSSDNKNLPKRDQNQKPSENSANKKKRRKRGKKKEEETQTDNTPAASPEQDGVSMTNRLEKMEKDFPSDAGLGIIKAPKPNEKSTETSSKEDVKKEEIQTEKSDKSSKEVAKSKEVSDTNKEAEADPTPPRKPKGRPGRKPQSKKRLAPNKDVKEETSGPSESTEHNEETKVKTKAKVKTSAKKKTTAKKASPKKAAPKADEKVSKSTEPQESNKPNDET